MESKIIQDISASAVDEAGKAAKFYGFLPIIPPEIKKGETDKTALLKLYLERKMMSLSQPTLIYAERPFPGSKEKKKHSRLESSLVSIGSGKSVCECLSIQAALAILKTLGYKNLEVEVNSIGDKESAGEFQKKMTAFIRKSYNSFPADLRQLTKKDPFALFREDRDEWRDFKVESPKPLDFLSEPSRIHFKEVLEFLEVMDVCYSINSCLLGDMETGSETVFSIKSDGVELASGFRFNRLGKKIGWKKDLPATILNISAKLKKPLKKVKPKTADPKFYLIQFGPEAKLKSFLVLEELHKAGAAVSHSIAKDKLGSQMGVAETSGIPYIILIGQKEAIENSVIIRQTATRAQQIVPIRELGAKVKELS